MLLRLIDYSALDRSGIAPLITGLAVAANDIAIAGNLLTLTAEVNKAREDGLAPADGAGALKVTLNESWLCNGFRLYAFRMLIGHYREGVKVLAELEKADTSSKISLRYSLSNLGCTLNSRTGLMARPVSVFTTIAP